MEVPSTLGIVTYQEKEDRYRGCYPESDLVQVEPPYIEFG